MFEILKNKEDLTDILVIFIIISLCYLGISAVLIEDFNTSPSPIMSFLGYNKWIIFKEGINFEKYHYLISRPWNIIPFIFLSISILSVFKVLITGKCSILKGFNFLQIVLLNITLMFLFLMPMFIESILFLVISSFIIKQTIVNIVKFINTNLNNSCTEVVSFIIDKSDSNIKINEFDSSDKKYYSRLKKYQGGR